MDAAGLRVGPRSNLLWGKGIVAVMTEVGIDLLGTRREWMEIRSLITEVVTCGESSAMRGRFICSCSGILLGRSCSRVAFFRIGGVDGKGKQAKA